MVKKWINLRIINNLAGLFFLAGLVLLLVACGYARPEGAGFTPYVVVVTPTQLPGTASARAQGVVQTVQALTPTVLATRTAEVAPVASITAPKTTPATLVVSDNKYTIKEGDTLLGIAVRLKVDVEDLIALNNIEDPGLLKIGQVLLVPPRTEPSPTPKP